METDVQRIIADPDLSVQAKAILVVAEIERQLRGSHQDIEIKLAYEDVIFHPYLTPFIPRVGELISCRLEVGKGLLTTLWRVTQIEHGVGMDRLGSVTVSVEPADTQTEMHWRRSQRKSVERSSGEKA
jgi:hypothetical protein